MGHTSTSDIIREIGVIFIQVILSFCSCFFFFSVMFSNPTFLNNNSMFVERLSSSRGDNRYGGIRKKV